MMLPAPLSFMRSWPEFAFAYSQQASMPHHVAPCMSSSRRRFAATGLHLSNRAAAVSPAWRLAPAPYGSIRRTGKALSYCNNQLMHKRTSLWHENTVWQCPISTRLTSCISARSLTSCTI